MTVTTRMRRATCGDHPTSPENRAHATLCPRIPNATQWTGRRRCKLVVAAASSSPSATLGARAAGRPKRRRSTTRCRPTRADRLLPSGGSGRRASGLRAERRECRVRGIGSQQLARYGRIGEFCRSPPMEPLAMHDGCGIRRQTRFVANALRCSVRRWEPTILTSTRCDRLALA
jgi:hypothetical protein